MKLFSRWLYCIITLVCSGVVFSQETGSFSHTVTFEEVDYEVTRELYFFVPTDYDATREYPLIVGFRGGPHANAGQFRDQLIFLADSLDAILLCAENAAHFWSDEGKTKQLFQYSIDYISEFYSIDTEMIYLTGLSYGGRHAVIVSMDTDNGPIPKIRGVIPFATGSEGDLQPDYEDINDFPPACICIGLDDSQNFINVANTLHQDIESNGGKALLNEIPGVGHTVEFDGFEDEMFECIEYIESTYAVSLINDSFHHFAIQLSPNPADQNITIGNINEIVGASVTITNHLGEICMRISHLSSNSIDISYLSEGKYNLILNTNGKSYVEQFIVY